MAKTKKSAVQLPLLEEGDVYVKGCGEEIIGKWRTGSKEFFATSDEILMECTNKYLENYSNYIPFCIQVSEFIRDASTDSPFVTTSAVGMDYLSEYTLAVIEG